MAARAPLPRPPGGLFEQWPGAIQWAPGKESPVELRLNASSEILCSQRAGHRFRTKTRAARVGNEARGAYMRTQRQAQACVGYFFAVREGSSPAMHAVMAGRVFADARTRGMLCRAGLDIDHGQPMIRIFRQKYDDCCRHSVMLHRSGIPSLQIERTMMKCHDQASLPGLHHYTYKRRVGLLKRIGGRPGRFSVQIAKNAPRRLLRPLCPSGSRGQT